MKTNKDDIELIKKYVFDRLDTILKKPHSFITSPFIDPGSVYDGNVWDWDTYWSVYGLLPLVDEAGDEALMDRVLIHAKGNVRNFFDHQLEDGYIPMMIEVADLPEPYLNLRHKEGIKMNMHKPFLAQQICLISDYIGDYSWALEYQNGLAKYFKHYKDNYFNLNCGLYVWHDDIMIGMDNDPTSFGRPYDSTANIFLNSFMVKELDCYEKYLEKLNLDETKVQEIKRQKEELITSIQAECYDNRDKFFYSVDVDIKTRKYDWFHEGLGVFWKTLPLKIRTWSGFLPMAMGFATTEQACQLVKHWKDKDTFYSEYGICTLAKDEKMFDLSITNNPSNWLGPIWIVANYLVFKGFINYGYINDAREIFEGTLKLLAEDLKRTGSLHEYYNPFTGEPIMNGGFVNWNILVLNMYADLKKFEKKIIVLDDDPTGVQTVHDIFVYTDWTEESIAAGFKDDNTTFFILTNSRALTASETEIVHRQIAERIAKISKQTDKDFILISRSDSTLRGHYPLETETLKKEFEKKGIKIDGEILCPYYKEGGRVTINNIHYVKYGENLIEASKTEFAQDETFGYKSSDLSEYVEEKTGGEYKASECICITLDELRNYKIKLIVDKLCAVNGFRKIIVNATTDEELRVFVIAYYKAISCGKNFLIRSAASFVKVVSGIKGRELLTREELLKNENTNGGVIVIGSHTQKTTHQLECLKEIRNIEFVEMNSDLVLDAGKLDEEVKRILQIEDEILKTGKTVCVYTNRELLKVDNDTKEQALLRSVEISDALQKCVGELTTLPKFVIAKGGITSSDVGVKALGVKKALVLGQIEQGIPVWRIGEESKFSGMPYVIFPGNVGNEETLKIVVEKLI